MNEPRAIVSVTAHDRHLDRRDDEARRVVRSEMGMTMNFPASSFSGGPDGGISDAIDTAIRAATPTGMLHDGVYRVEIVVEWDGFEDHEELAALERAAERGATAS